MSKGFAVASSTLFTLHLPQSSYCLRNPNFLHHHHYHGVRLNRPHYRPSCLRTQNSANEEAATKIPTSATEEAQTDAGETQNPAPNNKRTRQARAESTDWIASSLAGRFDLAGGHPCFAFLAFGVISEQVKTRLEVFQETQNTRGTSLHQRIMAQRLEIPCPVPVNADTDHFETLKQRFLSFKEQKYMKNIEQYSKLASEQNPTYMVIACGDSRVCPSTILGFEPGEAFIIRNIANLVPPYEETDLAGTSAAVEFAVLTLKVQHLIIIGHSCCGGIRALMSMPDEEAPPSGFIEKWVSVAKPARQRTKVAAGNLPFDDQCSHCEKESINQSLSNLFTFPFIKDLMAQKKLALHGGYYNFVNCSFEIWSLSSEAANAEDLKPEIVQYSQWS